MKKEIRLTNNHRINVINKTRKALDFIDKNKLNKIDRETETAKEIILIFLSRFCSSEFKEKKSIRLSSKLMKKIYGRRNNEWRYKNIIDILIIGSKLKGGIIQKTSNYSTNQNRSNQYSLTPAYQDKGISYYKLKTRGGLKLIEKDYINRINNISDNIIISNLMDAYEHMSIPSKQKVTKRGLEIINKKIRLKNGKTMEISTLEKDKNIVGLEDHLKIYNYCFNNGLIIPSISPNSGGRVSDSINICPAWIRKMIQLDGEDLISIDYSSLHPHIAMFIYEDQADRKSNDHTIVAEYFNKKKSEIKQDHNSFFNKKVWQMKTNYIYNYYKNHHPNMLQKIINTKLKDYKNVTITLFEMEVKIMSEVIKRLRKKNIYTLYIYDELLAKKSQADTVKCVMNEVVAEMGIMTQARYSISE